MNVNLFFIAIASGLAMIYFFFHPMKLGKLNQKEIAQLELEDFTISDIDTKGLKSVFKGTKGYRYLDRYEAFDVNYTDNSKQYRANLQADFGVYKDQVVQMYGDLVYKRSDGLVYISDDGSYNQKNGVLRTQGKYFSYRKDDRISGKNLMYDSKTEKATSDDVDAIYQLKNSEKL